MPFLLLLGLWLIAEMTIFVICLFKLGLLLTMAFVLLSSTVGVLLIRQQRQNMTAMLQMPDDKYNARNGVYQFTGGMLLTIPGFLSSLIGMIFLIPPVRRLVGRGLLTLFPLQTVTSAFFSFEQPNSYAAKQTKSAPQNVTATREDGTVIQGELVDDGKK